MTRKWKWRLRGLVQKLARQAVTNNALRSQTCNLILSLYYIVVVIMPVWCSVPYCANYKQAQKEGVIFHSLPTGDIPRCRKWLAAIKNNIYNVNTPVAKYQNIRVCSQHFRPEDYLRDYQSELMGKPNRRQLKRDAIPSVFSFTTKRKTSDQPTPAQKKRSRLEVT